METLWQDVRYAIRTLAKKPGFTFIAVLTLALGIGANTAIFTVVDAALLRPFPYKNPDRLMHLWETRAQQDFNLHEASYPDYLDWREQNTSFAAMAGYTSGTATLTGNGEPERVAVARATASFFPLLGVEPQLGRTFRDEEDQPGGERIVMISHGFWQRRFGADSQIIGQSLTLNDTSFTIVGVLPPNFQFAKVGSIDLWLPLKPAPMQMRRSLYWLKVIARLKPEATETQAQSEMSAIAARIEQQYADSHTGTGVKLVALRDEIVGNVRPLLLTLLGAVVFVLLIGCANVANLLLARSAARRKEIAIRVALGASRARLMQQLLTESVMLALAGGALGLLLAQWGIELLIAGIPASIITTMPYLQGLTIDAKVLGFTFALSLLTGIVFGLAPAFQGSKTDLNETLKESGKSSAGVARARLRSTLVVTEIALALMLLIGAGLMIKSMGRLLKVNPGFTTDHLLTFKLSLPPNRYNDPNKAIAFHQQMLARIENLPGVQSVGTTDLLPLSNGGMTGTFRVEGQPAPLPGENREVNLRTVSANYFEVMQIPLIGGRTFTARDDAKATNVLVINQTVAERWFPNQNAVGQRIIFVFDSAQKPWEIVGVIGDENVTGMDAKITPVVYFTYAQDNDTRIGVVVRTANDPTSITSAVRNEIRALDADVPVYAEMSMEQLIASSQSVFLRRYPAFLIGAFAVAALGLAMLGIYGVISYSVTQRTHEIGIRMALGARAGDVMLMILGQSTKLALAGIVIGIGGAFALTRVMASLLYGVSATDTATFITTSLILTGVALGASFIPARRAMKVDPMVALRYE